MHYLKMNIFSFLKSIAFISKYTCKVSIFTMLSTLPFYVIAQQNNMDSISNLPYEQLDKYFEKYNIDTSIDLKYARAYLNKAKKDQDTLRIANAFFHLSRCYTDSMSLYYTDSVILFTKEKNYDLYPERGYLLKANYLSYKGNYEEAIKFYYTTHEISIRKNNKLYQYTSKFNIAALKNRLGYTREALGIFKEYATFIETHPVQNQKQLLSISLLNIGTAYFYLGKTDSAEIVIKRGLTLSHSMEDTYLYPNFLILSGANLYKLKKYKRAIDSLNKGKKYFNEQVNIMISNMYLGKTYYALKDYEKAIGYLTSIDSFLVKSGNIELELLETYPVLIEHYKNKKDIEKQLIYTERLLHLDSLYDRKYHNSINLINRRFNIPELVKSREELLKELQQKALSSKRNMYLLLLTCILALLAMAYFIARNRVYKKRFKKVISNAPGKAYEVTVTNKNTADIDESLISEILMKLKKFESSNKFTNKNLTLTALAKELKTNNRYLSKIINENKGCNFANYINDLRLEFAIGKLKTDEKFRAFTIKAIAGEAGFKTAQSFSLTFYKRTGIYPSYFLQQLQKIN